MKIAFTHNLKLSQLEEEAEFDSPETISALRTHLESLGHQVDAVEVSGPPSRTLARLEALHPDLIFNTAEGSHGRFRESLYPALFEELGVPFSGSDAYVLALTLDKNLCKKIVSEAGVRVPKSALFTRLDDLSPLDLLRFPLLLKPNFEGSSKGISQDSVVTHLDALKNALPKLLARYPSGILAEEYIEGIDVAVPFLEGTSPKTKGILPAIRYRYPTLDRKFSIYDYDLKNLHADSVEVELLSEQHPAQSALQRFSKIAFSTLGIRDLGRLDFRVTEAGEAYFIEANALPSLEPGAGIYLSAATIGLDSPSKVLECILKSACKRNAVAYSTRQKRKASNRLKVGFAFNVKRIKPTDDPATDQDAEYDAPSTLDAIRDAIRSYGHEVIDFEANSDFPVLLHSSDIDFVFNIAEGLGGRNRESQVPAILELLNIPYTGSDSSSLTLTLDKALAKKVVAQAGVPTPKFQLFVTGKEPLKKDLRFPVIVKPVAEGSSKGVTDMSVARGEEELRTLTQAMIVKYRQGALAEEFLTGREFTVALLGERRPRVLPPMEIVFLNDKKDLPIYSYQHKLDPRGEVRYDNPALIDPLLKRRIEKTARTAFEALGCRDYARIDLRLNAEGEVNFIECNPLPGLTPGWSDLCLITQAAGMSYRELIGEIMAPAIRRLKEHRKQGTSIFL